MARPSSSSDRRGSASAEADGTVGIAGHSGGSGGGATRSPLRTYRVGGSTSSSSADAPPLGVPLGVRAVPCDSVGTAYLLPAAVYRWNSSSSSRGSNVRSSSVHEAGYFNLRHYAHVLTEHYPVVHAAKYLLGIEVVTVLSVVVMHADLPMYGEVRFISFLLGRTN